MAGAARTRTHFARTYAARGVSLCSRLFDVMLFGQRLVESKLVTIEQVQSALQLQVVHGGRLGSCLLKRGFIELDVLSAALSPGFVKVNVGPLPSTTIGKSSIAVAFLGERELVASM